VVSCGAYCYVAYLNRVPIATWRVLSFEFLGSCSACDMCRISLYADNAALFIDPTKDDLIVTYHIMSIFAQASGLVTNMGKT
jgi:hypothetical protein